MQIKRLTAALCLGALTIVAGCSNGGGPFVVGLVVEGCGPAEETGGGALVAPDLVLTAAHVLAGAEKITVYSKDWSSPGVIVAFDDEMDLAYVKVEDAPGDLFDVSTESVEAGDVGVAYVYRHRELAEVPVTIKRRININTEDIYVEGETRRPGFELGADIQLGDSGAPVVVDGSLVGVVWARSRRDGQRAYAIDPLRGGDLINEQLESGEIGDDIDLTRCP